jgi:hypothetical protein
VGGEVSVEMDLTGIEFRWQNVSDSKKFKVEAVAN